MASLSRLHTPIQVPVPVSESSRDNVSVHVLDEFVLPNTQWTVERLILISGLVSKAFNLKKESLEHLKETIRSLQLSSRTTSMLCRAIVPELMQVKLLLEKSNPDFFLRHARKVASVVQLDHAEGDVKNFNPGEEMCEKTKCFHRVVTSGVTPLVQNLFMPMGMRSHPTNGAEYRCCPFPVAGMNQRNCNATLSQSIFDNLFVDGPFYSMTELYTVMAVSKEYDTKAFESVLYGHTEKTKQSYTIPMHNYDHFFKDDTVLGTDPYQQSASSSESQGGHGFCCFPLVSKGLQFRHEFQNLLRTVPLPFPMEQFSNRMDQEDVNVNSTLRSHYLVALFKVHIENHLRAHMKRDLSQNRVINPVACIRDLALLMQKSGGPAMAPFFPFLNTTEIDPEEPNPPLPHYLHLCKFLLQGRTSIMDQALEGNHRLSVIATLFSCCLPGPLFEHLRDLGKVPLNTSLLFGDSAIVQVLPETTPYLEWQLDRSTVGVFTFCCFFITCFSSNH